MSVLTLRRFCLNLIKVEGLVGGLWGRPISPVDVREGQHYANNESEIVMLTKQTFMAIFASAVTALVAPIVHSEIDVSGLSEKAAQTLDRFEQTGDKSDCVRRHRIRSIKGLSDELFLIKYGAGEFFLTKAEKPCRDAAHRSTVIFANIGGGSCEVKSLRVSNRIFNPISQVGRDCSIGDFYELREKDIVG